MSLLNQYWENDRADKAREDKAASHDTCVDGREPKGPQQEIYDHAEAHIRTIHDREKDKDQDEVSILGQLQKLIRYRILFGLLLVGVLFSAL